jgi:hypothetical protein
VYLVRAHAGLDRFRGLDSTGHRLHLLHVGVDQSIYQSIYQSILAVERQQKLEQELILRIDLDLDGLWE